MEVEVVSATEVKDFSICGLTKRTLCILAFLLILVTGGVLGGVVFALLPSSGNEDPIQNPNSTVAPTAQLMDELRSWIAPTDAELSPFNNPYSPQSQALAWIASDPISVSTDRTTESVLERYALAVLYFATSGPSWAWSDPYMTSEDVCTWNDGEDLLFDPDSPPATLGVYCRSDTGTVEGIFLSVNKLLGSLPWELVLLPDLVIIDVNMNRLSGPIPTKLNELTRLERFIAFVNDLTGLPESFPSSSRVIDLGFNDLTGSIPEHWATSMPNLEKLLLHYNRLTGTLPTTYGQLSYLITFSMEQNLLSGTIPSQLGQIDSLIGFTAAGNWLTGSVEQFFCNRPPEVWEKLQTDCQQVSCSCCTSCQEDYGEFPGTWWVNPAGRRSV